MATREENEILAVRLSELRVNGFTKEQIKSSLKVSSETYTNLIGIASEYYKERFVESYDEARREHQISYEAQKRALWIEAKKCLGNVDGETLDRRGYLACMEALRRVEVEQQRLDGTYAEHGGGLTITAPMDFIKHAGEIAIGIRKRHNANRERNNV